MASHPTTSSEPPTSVAELARAMQARNVRDSLSADAAAELLFAGLDAGLLWIHTDPERSLRRVRERAHAILTGVPVEPPIEPAPVP